MQHGDLLMIPSIPVTDLCRPIGGAILYQNDLHGPVGLRQQTVQAFRKILFYVVCCYDH